MHKMKNLVSAAKLRHMNYSKGKCDNETRWTSTLEMVKRFQAISQFLKNLNITEVEYLLPGRGDEKRLHSMIDDLQNLYSITKMIQRENYNL